jgi:hypothetical protein
MKSANYESLGKFWLPYESLGYASNKAMIDELGEDYPHILKKWNSIIHKAQKELDEVVDRNKLISRPAEPRRVIIRIKKSKK